MRVEKVEQLNNALARALKKVAFTKWNMVKCERENMLFSMASMESDFS